MPGAGKLEFHPLTPERWRDLESLFGPRGACGGCWCMFWKLPRREFSRRKGEGNRRGAPLCSRCTRTFDDSRLRSA